MARESELKDFGNIIKSDSYRFCYIVALLLYLVVALNDFFDPPWDLHQYRQTQTLSTAYNFCQEGIDLLRPQLDDNGQHSVVILEFPLYQAIIALFAKHFGHLEQIGRVVNIILFVLSSLMVVKLINQFFCPNIGWLSAALFLLNPSAIFWSRTTLIEPIALFFTILFVYSLLTYCFYSKMKYYVIALLAGVIGAIIKPPVMFIGCLSCSAYFLFNIKRKKICMNVSIFLLFLAVLISVIAWRTYSANNHLVNPHMYTDRNMEVWYFGTWAQRFDITLWKNFFYRILFNHNGFFWIPGVLLCYLFRKRINNIALLYVLFGSFFLYLFIFVNLNVVHTYYQFPFALLSALASIPIFLILNRFVGKCLYVYPFIFLIASLYFVHGKWVDYKNDPYITKKMEFKVATDVNKFFNRYGLNEYKRRIVIINDIEWGDYTGPHTLMYYLKARGYTIHKSLPNSVQLEGASSIVRVSSNKEKLDWKGWALVEEKNINTPMFGTIWQVYLPVNSRTNQIYNNYEIIRSGKLLEPYSGYGIKGATTIYSDGSNVWNEQFFVDNISFDFFNIINVKATIQSSSKESHDAYILLRPQGKSCVTVSDQLRFLHLHEGTNKVEIVFFSDCVEQYNIVFGEKNVGEYTIENLSVSQKNVFTTPTIKL